MKSPQMREKKCAHRFFFCNAVQLLLCSSVSSGCIWGQLFCSLSLATWPQSQSPASLLQSSSVWVSCSECPSRCYAELLLRSHCNQAVCVCVCVTRQTGSVAALALPTFVLQPPTTLSLPQRCVSANALSQASLQTPKKGLWRADLWGDTKC